eukprot:TRINITY_DN51061_c0_g1_i1.p1 TRINITY_DN51061_c0_g1~~TRINITY_DN51061_c0_g1_i1.p1  ORF type:complete len:435 (-),score=86.24 TRINITY_DN51061_c0_g1_i1:62-1366(-)
MSQMPKDVEARIRALPGNRVCMDCSNVNPQWASVTYGGLMCLECSGQHRSLGVHLSFVRSIAMDAWKEREIAAMERSGGNDKVVAFFQSKGIQKSMPVVTKYNTKQAAYFRDRLQRFLDGKTEPPPDPGNYDPVSGGDAQGAEPLPGETTEEYNARQARLREVARERLRQKFGNGGMGGVGVGGSVMGGIGSDPDPGSSGGDGVLGALGGFGSFLKQNVIDNDTVRGAVGGVGNIAGGALGAIKRASVEGDVIGSLKRNVTAEDGSVVRGAIGWVGGVIGNKQEDSPFGGGYGARGTMSSGGSTPNGKPEEEDDEAFFASIGARKSSVTSSGGGGGDARKSDGKVGDNFKSDDWGEWGAGNKPVKQDDVKSTPSNGTSTTVRSSAPAAVATPAAVPAAAPASVSSGVAPARPEKVKKAPSKLGDDDDFFGAFGV